MKYTGKIIALAFPDTFVKMSDDWLCKLLPLVGLGTRTHIKAGHASLVLIENETAKAMYFDFGRYVTPNGYGRVRGSNTDVELKLPRNARISEDSNLENFGEIVLYLAANPEKTHGEGRMIASVCEEINFIKALNYIQNLQKRGNVIYSAFDKNGSNCSRFVTETILAATDSTKIIKALNFNKRFTPSTVGNVEKASTSGEVFEIESGKIIPFTGSAFKENLSNYFEKKTKMPITDTLLPSKEKNRLVPENAQKLDGIGCCAWFEMVHEVLPENHFRIKRYNANQELDFDGVFKTSSKFNLNGFFQFIYPSHCGECHIQQDSEEMKFAFVQEYANFNLPQKVRSV